MSSLSCAGVTAFTVASVPTGIKIDVWMSPWSVCKSPRRALDFFDVFFSSKRLMVANVEFYEMDVKTFFSLCHPGLCAGVGVLFVIPASERESPFMQK
jgi:hypothetical protein